MLKTIAIIQARMTSTRLPGKVLLKLGTLSVLERVLSRVRAATPVIGDVWIATSVDAEDDLIESFCKERQVNCFRGSREDVLDRFFRTAQNAGAEAIARITSDCPLIDPDVVKGVGALFHSNVKRGSDLTYVSNTLQRTFPRGLDCEFFTLGALEKAAKEGLLAYHREHVTPYMYQNPEVFKVLQFSTEQDYSQLRWTLDTPEDFEFLTQLIEGTASAGSALQPSTQDALSFLRNNPEIALINSQVRQKQLGE